MELKETKFVSDIIADQAITEDDILIIKPFCGRKKKYKLHYNIMNFESSNEDRMAKNRGNFFLPHLKNEKFKLQIRKEIFRSSLNEKKERFVFETLCGGIVRLNGELVFGGILRSGDLIEIGHNELIFKRSNTKSLELKEQEYIHPKIMSSNLPILICGETGTGKSSLAKHIHKESKRNGKFVHLNLSAIPDNLIESELFGFVRGAFTGADKSKIGAFIQANGGTLFLDEVDSLPFEIQTKLLLFLDDKNVTALGSQIPIQVNARIIFSSGQKLETLVRAGKMRKDFYYRISAGHQVYLPSLRDTTNSIAQFCRDFEQSHDLFIQPDLINFYESLPWPGNFRQLKGHLERKKVLADGFRLNFDESDEELISMGSDLNQLAEFESSMSLSELKEAYVKRIYFKSNKNATIAAEKLKISVRSVRSVING